MASREPLRIEFSASLDSIIDRECVLTGGDHSPVVKFTPETKAELRAWGAKLDGYFRITIEEEPEPEEPEEVDRG